LDEEIHTQKGISPFRFCLGGLPKKQIAGIEEENFFPLASDPMD
jgi:hypothetical protein